MNKHTSSSSPDFCDMVTLGERGQVVIPQAIRERAGLEPGDKLMVVFKDGPMIGLVPPASMRQWISTLTGQLSRIEEAENDDVTTNKENH